MTAQVIPIVRLPFGASSVFDYHIPPRMRLVSGMLVAVPFRNKTIYAIVRSCANTASVHKLKEIERIATKEPVFDRIGWRFFDWLVKDLCVHPSMVASQMFSHLPRTRGALSLRGLRGTVRRAGTARLVWHDSNSDLQKELHELEDVLILCPLIARAHEIAGLINRPAVVFTHLSGKRVWWDILDRKKSPVVLSTRIGALLPRRFKRIVVIDEEDQDHKQSDLNPRYDSRRIAYMRHSLEGSTLTLTSRCPRVVSYAATKRKMLVLNRSTVDSVPEPRRIIVPPQASSMSTPLLEAIRTALDQKKSIVLFHGTTGFARLLRCDECGAVAACDTCGLPMRPAKEAILSCIRCSVSKPIMLQCQSCNSIHMRPIGFGVERLETQVHKEFNQDNSIVVTTPQLLRLPEQSYPVNLVAIPSLESIYHTSGYNGFERAVAIVRKLALFARLHGAQLVIQSFSEMAVPVTIEEIERFYEKELEERQKLRLPPYAQLFRVILTGGVSSVMVSTRRLRERFGDRIELLDPERVEQRARKRVAKSLYFKVPFNSSSAELCQMICEIPGAHLDRDPQVL